MGASVYIEEGVSGWLGRSQWMVRGESGDDWGRTQWMLWDESVDDVGRSQWIVGESVDSGGVSE